MMETSSEDETDTEIRRGSLPLNSLADDERKFFDLVEESNTQNVRDFLKAHPGLNVNSVDYQGLTALHFAVKAENADIVALLLSRPDIQLKDVVLHAIATGNIEITETILKALNDHIPESEYQTYDDSAEYSDDITPLLLAARCGSFPMVRMLLARDHRIDRPHKPACLCATCKALMSETMSSLSQIRLNCYKALSNPSYISQVTSDPILYSFLLDNELKECAQIDKEYRNEYLGLAEELRSFVVKLSSECRNATEMEIILKQPSGFKGADDITFPRLQLAVDCTQKEFVANSLVQQVLTSFWLGESRSWNRLTLVQKTCRTLLRIITLPAIVLAVIFAPGSKFSNKYKAPVNKFVSSLASYLVFVFFVYLLSELDEKRSKRGPPRTGCEAIVIIFVVGFIVSSIKQLWSQGRIFFRVAWHCYDVIMEVLFVITFFLWSASAADAKKERDKKTANNQRKFWKSSDPTLLHEGFFAICCIMSYGRLAFYCLQSSRLGPMQVSLGKMASQIGYFVIFLLTLITSFALPMTKLYIYYGGMIQTDKDGQTTEMLDSFTSFSNSFGTLFWAMFCMSPTESVNVVIENIGGDKKNPIINHHVFTESVGRLLFSVYQFLVAVALFNTLIAVLSNTFQRIVDNADVEWKFARTKLWLNFFHEASTLPSPFNLIPRPSVFMGCGAYCMALANKTPGAKARFSLKRLWYIEYDKVHPEDETLYETLMTHLVQRYFRREEQNSE